MEDDLLYANYRSSANSFTRLNLNFCMKGIYWSYGIYSFFIGVLIFCIVLVGRRWRNRRG
ncbi:hypothetical protein Slin_6801 (plasmid) [Spirosoma linguale DSM 74]|uniref:Uncharacterized protein n=1 Tax=Spirosoma linguale (strain ATCC 33905 / DSM 74 / LMG 10896 / Claus 1) TaxID=504472 RepID=D2QVB9_SPILD|nr:hypothetical protein Slin_6801 [Spirosoma linguale DSM 74]